MYPEEVLLPSPSVSPTSPLSPPKISRGRETWGLGVRYICIQSPVTPYDPLGRSSPLPKPQFPHLQNRLDATFPKSFQGSMCISYQQTSGICCCCSVTQSEPILCDPMGCSMPGLPGPHHLPKFAQVHVHCIK